MAFISIEIPHFLLMTFETVHLALMPKSNIILKIVPQKMNLRNTNVLRCEEKKREINALLHKKWHFSFLSIEIHLITARVVFSRFPEKQKEKRGSDKWAMYKIPSIIAITIIRECWKRTFFYLIFRWYFLFGRDICDKQKKRKINRKIPSNSTRIRIQYLFSSSSKIQF